MCRKVWEPILPPPKKKKTCVFSMFAKPWETDTVGPEVHDKMIGLDSLEMFRRSNRGEMSINVVNACRNEIIKGCERFGKIRC